MPSKEQVTGAVAAYAAAVSAADRDAILACYGPTPRVSDPYPSTPGEGREGVARHWDNVLGMGRPYSFEPHHVVVGGDRAIFNFTIRLEIGEGDGRARVQVDGFDVMTIGDDGLIVEQIGYWDPADVRPVDY
jgi:ketosteroid isomerase-like protein